MCIVLCFYGGLTLFAAYYKLFQKEMELTSIVTAVYLASYVIPPILYDCKNFWNHLGLELLIWLWFALFVLLLSYKLAIPVCN